MILGERKMKSVKANKEVMELRDAIAEIAEIIHMEMPLRYQDKWLEMMVERGLWKPDPDLVEGQKKET